MFGSPTPVKISREPFGPTVVWLPDRDAIDNRKAKKRLVHSRVRVDNVMHRASPPPADQVQSLIVDRLPRASLVDTTFVWPSIDEIQGAMLLGASIGTVGLMWNPPVGTMDPGVHAFGVFTLAEMDDDPVKNALLSWVARLSLACMVYGSRRGVEWSGHEPFLSASMMYADDLRKFA